MDRIPLHLPAPHRQASPSILDPEVRHAKEGCARLIVDTDEADNTDLVCVVQDYSALPTAASGSKTVLNTGMVVRCHKPK